MLDSIRDKFHSLQENLTTTLKSLSVSDPLNRRQDIQEITSVNFNAGTDLLDGFQTSWAELHEASLVNASKAEEVDDLICTLQKKNEKHWKDIGHLASVLVSLPEVVYSVNNLCDKIMVLEGLFDTVEKALIQLEDIIETREFQNQQLEHRFQLALHKEKKLVMLENVRFNLADELAEKVRRHEVKQQRLLKECQEASEENFARDLKLYKETNTIPKVEFAKPKSATKNEKEINSLEDIVLDNADTEALDEFLNDTVNAEKDSSKQ